QTNERFLLADSENRTVRWDVMDINKTLGRMLTRANQPALATRFFDRALDLSRGLVKEVPLSRQTTAKDYSHYLARLCLEAGRMYRERGRHGEALRMLEEALSPAGIGEWLERLAPYRTREYKFGVGLLNPFKTEARVKLEYARIHLEEGRYAEAL